MRNIHEYLSDIELTTRVTKDPIIVRKDHCEVAFESINRHTIDENWLIYIPPTMSPCKTSSFDEYLEHPIEALEYYKNEGISHVVCETKHMGSRAVIVVCRDDSVAKRKFKSTDGTIGRIYSRLGKKFFNDPEVEKEILQRLVINLNRSNFWGIHKTDWVCLDCEIMPWSTKAKGLIIKQYATTGATGRESLSAANKSLRSAIARGYETPSGVSKTTSGQNADLVQVLKKFENLEECMLKYETAYKNYCWSTNSVDDLKIAPFHIMATENKVWSEESHIKHLFPIDSFCLDNLFIKTERLYINLNQEEEIGTAIDWWKANTEKLAEGMVIKPWYFSQKNKDKEFVQPAIKCRGREYLRIIYGPDYTTKGHLERLKRRSLKRKRQLALNEFLLGIEGLKKFCFGAPFESWTKYVFACLALETEALDPRL